MEEDKLSNYVTICREITSDYRNGKLTKPERNLLLWLRVNGNPYGISIADLELLSRETFNENVSKSYINKLMLSLKSKRYIWYKERSGRRGSFEVHHDKWIRPDKTIKTLKSHFEDDLVRGSGADVVKGKSELIPEVSVLSQRSDVIEQGLSKEEWIAKINVSARGYDTDKEKEKEKTIVCNKGTDCIPTVSFRADTLNESRLVDFARLCGDRCMNFYLGKYKKYGEKAIEAMERARLTYLEVISKSEIENEPAYFNSLVCKELGENLI